MDDLHPPTEVLVACYINDETYSDQVNYNEPSSTNTSPLSSAPSSPRNLDDASDDDDESKNHRGLDQAYANYRAFTTQCKELERVKIATRESRKARLRATRPLSARSTFLVDEISTPFDEPMLLDESEGRKIPEIPLGFHARNEVCAKQPILNPSNKQICCPVTKETHDMRAENELFLFESPSKVTESHTSKTDIGMLQMELSTNLNATCDSRTVIGLLPLEFQSNSNDSVILDFDRQAYRNQNFIGKETTNTDDAPADEQRWCAAVAKDSRPLSFEHDPTFVEEETSREYHLFDSLKNLDCVQYLLLPKSISRSDESNDNRLENFEEDPTFKEQLQLETYQTSAFTTSFLPQQQEKREDNAAMHMNHLPGVKSIVNLSTKYLEFCSDLTAKDESFRLQLDPSLDEELRDISLIANEVYEESESEAIVTHTSSSMKQQDTNTTDQSLDKSNTFVISGESDNSHQIRDWSSHANDTSSSGRYEKSFLHDPDGLFSRHSFRSDSEILSHEVSDEEYLTRHSSDTLTDVHVSRIQSESKYDSYSLNLSRETYQSESSSRPLLGRKVEKDLNPISVYNTSNSINEHLINFLKNDSDFNSSRDRSTTHSRTIDSETSISLTEKSSFGGSAQSTSRAPYYEYSNKHDHRRQLDASDTRPMTSSVLCASPLRSFRLRKDESIFNESADETELYELPLLNPRIVRSSTFHHEPDLKSEHETRHRLNKYYNGTIFDDERHQTRKTNVNEMTSSKECRTVKSFDEVNSKGRGRNKNRCRSDEPLTYIYQTRSHSWYNKMS